MSLTIQHGDIVGKIMGYRANLVWKRGMPIPEHGNFGKEHDDQAVDYGLPYFSKLYNPPIINQQGFNRQVQSTWVVPAPFFFEAMHVS